MPFVPMDPTDKPWKPPCRDPQHYPPSHIVISHPMKWQCGSCGFTVVLVPSTATLSCDISSTTVDSSTPAVTKTFGAKTKSQVLRERKYGPGGSGCCDRYADQMACECLKRAVCDECSGTGWAVHPQNGWNRDAKRCSRGCPSRCNVCGNPNCDNPNGQH